MSPANVLTTSDAESAVSQQVARRVLTPPLEPGDHLSRDEFERRYHLMPGVKKAELLEGVVHMPSPVRWDQHGRQHAQIIHWLVTYEHATDGVQTADNATIRLDLDNEPQPDATLIIAPPFGGKVALEDGYVVGAPELVVEVAASSASIDLHTKLRVYRRAGVKEYLVWRVFDDAVDWFVLRGSEFQPLAMDPQGIIKSETFPGLWLSVSDLVASRFRQVTAVLKQGLDSSEHAAFVGRLSASRT